MKIGFIGAGRVGTSMGKLFAQKDMVKGFYSLFLPDALYAAHKTNTAVAYSKEDLVNACDIIFITVPDGSITDVWNSIKAYAKGKTVCHMSGALASSAAFPDSEEYNIKVASMHPMLAVSDKFMAEDLKTAFFTVEGTAKDEITKILDIFGISYKVIAEDKKTAYHAGCVFASNLVHALLKESCELFSECGFDEKEALSALENLTKKNMDSLFEKGFVNSLTGPVDRCDTVTVKKHSDLLHGDDKEVYRLLSKKLIGIAEEKNPQTNYETLKEEL